MVNERIEFKNLEYIVMEGGGARGATYLGAIRALEKLMQERMDNDPTHIFCFNPTGRKPGLLDYYKTENNINKPVIKGIAGSSAGAITTFGLALGLNSEDVDTVLQFPFQRFLEERDAGKYRMVKEDGELAIGQDKRNKKTKNKELHVDKTFEYDFSSDSTYIGDNTFKRANRNFWATIITKVLIDGIGSQVQQFGNVRAWLDKKTDGEGTRTSSLRWFLKMILRTRNNFFDKLVFQKLFNAGVFKLLIPAFTNVPMKFDVDNVTNLLFDRGMYSGFQIREFFMDMMIFAATRVTVFHRGALEWYKKTYLNKIDNPDYKDKIIEDIKNNLLTTEFEIGNRSKAKFNDKTILFLHAISKINFREFNEITGINFGMCVANLTTGNPMYFGHEWTPDFRVLEAVAGSMSIPPAIKPLYNEADVVKPQPGKRPSFINKDGLFDLHDFYKWQHLVKKRLQQEIYDDDKTKGTIVDLNNEMDVSAFLPKLRDVVNGEYKTDTATGEITMDPPKTGRKTKVKYQGDEYTIDYYTYLFFYNATYKGMFIDGGYRNNIPYNFFRMRNDNIDRLVAIKIDEHFPPDLLESVYAKIKMKLAHIDAEEFINELYMSPGKIEDSSEIGSILNQIEKVETVKHKLTKQDIINETRKVFEMYMAKPNINKDGTIPSHIIKQMALDNKAMKSLAIATLKAYKRKQYSAPWKEAVGIMTTAFDGYGYGNEKGQVRNITDHNQILPLYDCGVSTFDFDMKKVLPMIKMAQAQAEEHTIEFFKKGNQL